jgi:hypothetical protein
MGAFIAIQQCLGGAVQIWIDDADDFEIAVLEHRAMIARTPGLDRPARGHRTRMEPARGQSKAKPRIGRLPGIEIAHSNTGMVEFDVE